MHFPLTCIARRSASPRGFHAHAVTYVMSSSFRWTTFTLSFTRYVVEIFMYCVGERISIGENIAILSRVLPMKFDWHVINSGFVASDSHCYVRIWIFSSRAFMKLFVGMCTLIDTKELYEADRRLYVILASRSDSLPIRMNDFLHIALSSSMNIIVDFVNVTMLGI